MGQTVNTERGIGCIVAKGYEDNELYYQVQHPNHYIKNMRYWYPESHLYNFNGSSCEN